MFFKALQPFYEIGKVRMVLLVFPSAVHHTKMFSSYIGGIMSVFSRFAGIMFQKHAQIVKKLICDVVKNACFYGVSPK